MNYDQLHHAVQNAAGLRLRLRLQPLYGAGEIVFPCTVAGGKYQISKRRIPGYPESVDCAVLDSVQSQANRMEEALLRDIRAEKIFIPHVVTDFAGVKGLAKPVGQITCDYIQLSTTISFPALRQLGFPADNAESTGRGQTVLAAMALHAAALNVERGWHLRSRCDLILDEGEKVKWEVLGGAKRHTLTAENSRKLLEEAVKRAAKDGLTWNQKPLQLTPSPALQQLVIRSQAAHRTAPAGD